MVEPEINHSLSELQMKLLCGLVFCVGNQNLTNLRDRVQKKEAYDMYCCRIQTWRLFPWLGSYVAAMQRLRFAIKYRKEVMLLVLPLLF